MKRLTLAALVLAAGAAVAAPKADIAKGKEVATTICAACHAADGNSGIAMYPKLAAQHSAYIYRQTLDIKEGKRTNGSAAVMKPMVMNLSEQDILNVSAFYAKQQAKSGEANPKQMILFWAAKFTEAVWWIKKFLPVCPATVPAAQVFRAAALKSSLIRA